MSARRGERKGGGNGNFRGKGCDKKRKRIRLEVVGASL